MVNWESGYIQFTLYNILGETHNPGVSRQQFENRLYGYVDKKLYTRYLK